MAAGSAAFRDWQGRRHFAGLAGVRAIAILAVVCHNGPFPYLVGARGPRLRGFAGVKLFFVLSGFLIAALVSPVRSLAVEERICLVWPLR